MQNQNIVDYIKSLPRLFSTGPVEDADIDAAEKQLGLKFAPEYREYTKHFGGISVFGVELSGVTPPKRLNVCHQTVPEREYNESVRPDMYVIDDTGLEGLVYLQDASGTVYSVSGHGEPKVFCGSLMKYLEEQRRIWDGYLNE